MPILEKCDALSDFVFSLRDTYFQGWQWIDKYKEPYFDIFLSYTIDLQNFTSHIQNNYCQLESFDFTIRCAITQISDTAGCMVNLVTDDGLQNFLTLLSAIDDGNLENHHPGNYVPAILVGWHLECGKATEICRQINKQDFEYSGRINRLTVLESADKGFKDVYSFNFKRLKKG